MISKYGRLRMAWRVLRGDVVPDPYFLPTVEITTKGATIETRQHGWVNIRVRSDG